MASVEKRFRKPCERCQHTYPKHEGRQLLCATGGCACKGWRPTDGEAPSYNVRYRDPSGKPRRKAFVRKVDADRWMSDNESSKNQGAWVDPRAGRVQLERQAERWYATTAALTPSTRHDYRALLDNQVLPRFGSGPIAEVDALAVKAWFSDLVAGGIGVKRARKAVAILRQVLASAVDEGRLARNAAAGVKLPRAQDPEMLFLDPRQVEALADAIREPYGALIRFAAYSGVRPSELVALKVGRLDLLRGTARIAEGATEVNGHLEWGGVKTHEARTVRLPRSVAQEIGAYLDGRPSGPDDLVFTAPLGGVIRCSKWVKKTFKPAIGRANEAIAAQGSKASCAPLPEGLRLYDLRHSCASLLLREGASVKLVQAQLGHKTASQTLDRYGHLMPDESDVVADRLETARTAALEARRSAGVRPKRGPSVVPLGAAAGQGR